MGHIEQVLFVVLAGIAVSLFWRNAMRIRKNILLGKDEDYSDSKGERWKNMLLIAFGQNKMFRKPLVALMHFIIYAGFIIINVEVLEIALDGLLGTHRVFAPLLGSVYPVLINSFEILALGVIVVCVAFLARRNVIKVRRLVTRTSTAGRNLTLTIYSLQK